ncbi:hypothetical protein NLG97_g2245 [Lecanicillium saksenae]|uniref:Uncharacterized protein n=1 Tax=Lecanicillium saksenae TaxID=468837 RepID=A0ACC1R461_9HYPO|nr:hypothetical protein NLG97_g2245 [Lecanicillium saksenae]
MQIHASFVLALAIAVQATHVDLFSACYNPADPNCWPSCISTAYKRTVSNCGCNNVSNNEFNAIYVHYEGQGVTLYKNSGCTGDVQGTYSSDGCHGEDLTTINSIHISC